MKHIEWEYECGTNYYHIYPVSPAGEKLIPISVNFEIPETNENDIAVTRLVCSLNELAEGNRGE